MSCPQVRWQVKTGWLSDSGTPEEYLLMYDTPRWRLDGFELGNSMWTLSIHLHICSSPLKGAVCKICPDMSIINIKKEHLNIWKKSNLYSYRRYTVIFFVSQNLQVISASASLSLVLCYIVNVYCPYVFSQKILWKTTMMQAVCIFTLTEMERYVPGTVE